MARGRYVGATKRADLAEARQLGRRWVVQEKKDGIYVRICLDSRGRVGHVFSRSEREVHRNQLSGIRGALLGRPHAELVGELEASTESACAAVKKRGQPLVHLFDCLHDGTHSLADRPYSARRDALYRMQSEVVNYGPDAPWLRDADGRARERDSGRYTHEKLTDWRVAPIVPQSPLASLGDAWERVKADDLEGLVLVNLDAKAGARASKLKLKPLETIDALVLTAARTTIVCTWNGHPFTVGRTRAADGVAEGDVVEVRHAGWYDGSVTPRFPALVRVRRDLH